VLLTEYLYLLSFLSVFFLLSFFIAVSATSRCLFVLVGSGIITSGFYPWCGGEEGRGACFEFDWKTHYLEVSMDVRSPYRQISGWYLKLGHDGFFPRPLRFIIHYRTIIRGVFKTKLITFPKCILFYSLVYVRFTESLENIKFVCVFMLFMSLH